MLSKAELITTACTPPMQSQNGTPEKSTSPNILSHPALGSSARRVSSARLSPQSSLGISPQRQSRGSDGLRTSKSGTLSVQQLE
eukprot:scaffold457044_cov18-Prasinocladus_malaysianus.AAC.1